MKIIGKPQTNEGEEMQAEAKNNEGPSWKQSKQAGNRKKEMEEAGRVEDLRFSLQLAGILV